MELKDFEKKDLIGAAEFFAVEVDKSKKIEVIAEALIEEGITPNEIFKNNPDLKEKYADKLGINKPAVTPENVVKAGDMNAKPEARELPEESAVRLANESIVQQAQSAQQFLVKMRRKNPRFDVSGYTFTDEHPYAVVEAQHLNAVLSEEGFSIATPDEVTEYYS